jgi:hypothetical protein
LLRQALYEAVLADEPLAYWPLDAALSGLPLTVETVGVQLAGKYRDVCGEAHGVLHNEKV